MKPKPDHYKQHRSQTILLLSGSVIGLLIMGDSLLYSILPLSADSLGIPIAQVGILLSINRLVRLVSNTFASTLYARLGTRLPFLGSAVLGLLTTFAYGVSTGFAAFFLARVLWGVAWSGLRQGAYQVTWTGSPQVKGQMMGTLWGLFRLGSAIAVILGGFVFDRYGFRTSVWTVAVFGLFAVPLSASIPWDKATHASSLRIPLLSRIGQVTQESRNRWLIASGLADGFFQSILIATASLFVVGLLGTQELTLFPGVATVAGVLLGVRWISGIVVGPIMGRLSDRFRQHHTAFLLSGISLLGILLATVPSPLVALFALLSVLLVGSGLFVTLNASASGLGAETEDRDLFASAYNTAVDAGTGIGPLLAFPLANALGLMPLYLLAGLLQFIVILRHWQEERRIEC